jgi:hypothetical protein
MLALIGTKHSSFFPCFLQRTKLRKKEAGQQETNDPNKHKVGLTKSLKKYSASLSFFGKIQILSF